MTPTTITTPRPSGEQGWSALGHVGPVSSGTRRIANRHDDFLVTADIRAFERGRAVHAGAWSYRIPRDGA